MRSNESHLISSGKDRRGGQKIALAAAGRQLKRRVNGGGLLGIGWRGKCVRRRVERQALAQSCEFFRSSGF